MCYLTEPGCHDAAFVLHGSMVPVQIYLGEQLWQRSGDRALLATIYPRLAQMHAFMAVRHGSSSCRMPSGLLRPFDYFYNSGGWDDYPAQDACHARGLKARCAPVSNTCHGIRCAQILKRMATLLGQDTSAYDDIAVFTEALQEHSWNEAEGCYSWMIHDERGQAVERLRHESGVDHNLGLGGCYPLVAGICTPAQEERLLELLMGPGRCWSPIGLSAVDQQAPYYDPNGYWNGTVWMPHQWFFWKALLGMGRSEEAWRIASTALELWTREIAASDQCYEHFTIAEQRGAGWHHFGGLSSPVVNWYASYHRPGTLTTGFGIWLDSCEWAGDQRSCRAKLRCEAAAHHRPTLLICLPEDGRHTAQFGGQDLPLTERLPGCYEIALAPDAEGELRIS